MIRVLVTDKSGRPIKVEEKLWRLGRNVPTSGRAAIKEVGDALVFEMKSRVRVWRGYLRRTIRADAIDKNTIGIKTAYYGLALELGHPFKEITPKFKRWAISKAGIRAPWLLAGMLMKGYAEPHPFITPSVEAIKPKLHPILRKHVGFAIRRSGFK